jgi:hypothetical protein
MDLPQYIREHDEAGQSPNDDCEVEYRLLCSGTLHRELLGDWTKSDVARRVVDAPFRLFVASQPIDSNPQELSLRFRIGPETVGPTYNQLTHHPDEEVVEDLAGFLTVVFRRPVSVLGRTRTVYLNMEGLSGPGDFPNPIFNLAGRHWTPRGSTVNYGPPPNPIQITNNDPPPVAVSPGPIIKQLRGLASSNSQDVLRAIRLYTTALELIYERPQVSYLLLVSAIESLANEALRNWLPSDDDRAKHQHAVAKLAKKFELSDEQGRDLALTASKTEHWVKRKFVNFVLEKAGAHAWEEDEVFPWVLRLWQPDQSKLETYVKKIYDFRSDVLHEGQVFPLAITMGTSPRIDVRVAHDLFSGDSENRLAPLGWFERIVNICIQSRLAEIST